MDPTRFDALVRSLFAATTRRGVVGLLLGAGIAGREREAFAGSKKRKSKKGNLRANRRRKGARDGASKRRNAKDRTARPAAAEATRCCSTGACAPGKGKNLARCCYQGQDLTGKNFSGSNLGEANFSGARLTNANVQGANLGKACLVDANLTGVKSNASTNWGGATYCRTRTDSGENNSGCGKGTSCCPTCDASHPCPVGQICCAGTCVSGACCTTRDCADRICQDAACVDRQCVYAPISGTVGPDCPSICCDGACVTASGVCGGTCDTICTREQTCCGEKCVPTATLCGGKCTNICAAGEVCCGEKCTPAKLLCGGNCQNTCPENLTCCGQGACQECCGRDVTTCKPAGTCALVTCENGLCAYATDKDGTPCEAGKGTCCQGICVATDALCGGACGNVCAAPRPNCCGQSCQECCTDAHCANPEAPFCLGSQCVDEHVVLVFERVRTVVADMLGIDESGITMASAFIADLNADSLDVVELILAMEEEFGITITDEEAETIRTVGDAVRFIVANGG